MKTVSAAQLEQMIAKNENLNLLDVRPHVQYVDKHLPGSRSVPLKAAGEPFVERARKAVPDPRSEVVVYCGGKSCDLSPRAAETLEKAGFSRVVDFEGGVEDWERSGRNFARAS